MWTASPPLVPGTSENRRVVPYGRQAGATSLKVPLETPVEGEWKEGRFYVPARLANTEPHTNQRFEFLACAKQNWDRWVAWRARRGWQVVGERQLHGPFDVPTEHTDDEWDEEMRMFYFLARFKRTTPLYVGLDDFLEIRRKAELYGVTDTNLPWNPDERGDSGWVDPLKYAQERRERLGLKREDFLFDALSEPL